MVKKIRLTVAYDGTDFSGFQAQPQKRTIQGTLEETLSQLTGETIQIYGSGRTDAGVHALGQICHFTTSSPIPIAKYPYLLRHRLPQDILVLSAERTEPDFHARKDACWKTYRYQIETSPFPHLFQRRYCTHLPYPLDLEAMRQGAEYLRGTHDFTSFCSARTAIVDRVRTIYQIEIKEEAGMVSVETTGNGFLYNMVRILVGTLYEVGRGKRSSVEIPRIILTQDRQKAGPTLPPQGLILTEVGYSKWSNP